jgi:hypothetical protein
MAAIQKHFLKIDEKGSSFYAQSSVGFTSRAHGPPVGKLRNLLKFTLQCLVKKGFSREK